ncbi:DUF11 domain-containing protein [Candidatus Falkowbacteria bacterium]|nr:DUF11 domain-containing protein [Candidatus Falkowbacteria bacterium]NCQ12662.1 DUF11 domain-containing protein [Candidatus Falkowbacteria bacterium]OIO06226.1 MAG: hypothetical protein AUJ26_01215 [Candidatus Falkowbacteria bacterium CG1_02_37_21]
MSKIKKIKRVLRVGRAVDSSLSSFVERPVPSETEVAVFERVMKREVHEQEVDSNLAEIYSGKNGAKINVQKMNVKKRLGFFGRLLRRLVLLLIVVGAGYLLYWYGWSGTNNVNGLELQVKAPDKILAGEEFSYEITYYNPTKYSLSQVHLELQYPDSFIITSASPAATSGNYGWNLSDMAPGASATLTVTGRLIAPPDSVAVIFSRLSYLPSGLTSEFKKESSASTILSGPGFQVDLNYSATAFINQDNDMGLVIYNIEDNRLGDFNISFSVPADASASVVTSDTSVDASATSTKKLTVTKIGGASWQVSGLSQEMGRQEIPLTYRVKQKADNLEIKVRLEKKLEDGQSYTFWEKSLKPELVNSDLNLTMLLNDSKNDGDLNSGQSLNYSLTYVNHGINTFKDVVIMAVLKGEMLNWESLADVNKGDVQSNSIIWTKNEIPALAEIKPGAEGAIDFSLKLRSFQDSDIAKDLTLVSYGQYGINNQVAKSHDNISNTVTSRLNSDLSLQEEIRYFNSDNIPVGSGPLPPEVGVQTSFKVYWTVKNNLHELSETRVVFTLPSYVSWNNNNMTNVGSLYYDEASRQVIWEIGRLPVSVYRVDAEFGISIIPSDNDRNKILILSPGSIVSALDTETKGTITKKITSKTTKLEDDDIANLSNSGVVR